MELGESSTSTPRQPKRKRGGAFDGITPHASSSSSGAVLKGPYDVFINHRGCDTKHKLASTIYHTLDLIGLRAFLDENELELGDSIPQEIQEAMRTCGLHIAIFSERYAESPWCLAELCFMEKSGIPIIPVLYHVDPSDLRWLAQGKGCYAAAFSQHEEKGRYSTTIVEDWKSALQKVSNLSGYMLNSRNNDEGKLLKSIVNSVLRTMKKVPLEVAKHPIAMDEIVEDFERSRGKSVQGEQRVQIVGIVGFGGSGKKTLATELYNRKSSSFDRSSFLHDMRDAASKNALDTKQKKLLEDLRIQSVRNFDNSKEGRGFVADRLKGLRVLIVLDDVDHEDQLDALLPAKESLGSESLVIVTTRKGDVLSKWGITSIYKIKPLQHLHASNLFCWHAFLQPFPQQGFEDLVKNCLDICSGLPLSLKVIGGQLYGKSSRDYWVSQIEKIRRIFPKEILQRLKVSYDALDEDEKEMFLDVACFFIGKRRSSAIAVWDGSGWSGLCSWETLLNKCLVEVDGEELIRMHDHLRDLGRHIAMTHSPLRIWSDERQSMHIQPRMPVRGIMPATGRKCEPLFKEYMKMMRTSNVGLQLLEVEGDELTQECGELCRDLLWLRWSAFRHRNIQWLSLENIRVLSLSDCFSLESLWEDDHAPLQLRELAIKRAWELQSLPGSIGHLKHLKRLVVTITFFQSPLSIPEEFCRLQSLEHLDLSSNWKLASLPSRFGDLVNLRHIDLGGCGFKMLPLSFKQLIHLEYLNLHGCSKLTLKTDVLDNMTKLKVVNFSGCRKLQVLPHNITSQTYLRNLGFSYTRSLRELPASIDQLSELEELLFKELPLLTRLPYSLGNLSNLITLRLEECPQLYDLPSLAGLVSLNNLHVEDCRQLYTIPSLAGLVSLSNLHVKNCPQLYNMQSLAGLVSLSNLHVEDCPQLYNMPSLSGLVSLSNLCVQGCPGIMKIEGLENLTSLEKLIVRTDWEKPGIHSLRCAERLRTLTLQAVDISAFGACVESIQMEKWPWQMTIYGKILHGDGLILHNFTFPGLVVRYKLQYSGEDDYDRFWSVRDVWSLEWKLTYPSNAAIFCFEIHNFASFTRTISIGGIESAGVRVGPGKWILMFVLREFPRATDERVKVSLEQKEENWRVEGGWLIVGERGDVIAGFKELVQLFVKPHMISSF